MVKAMVTFEVLRRFEVDGQVVEPRTRIKLSFDSAKRFWDAGDLRLSEIQTDPPFVAIEHATQRLSDRTVLGPESGSQKLLKRIAEELISAGRISGTVDGKEVRWHHRALERYVWTEICGAIKLEDATIWQGHVRQCGGDSGLAI